MEDNAEIFKLAQKAFEQGHFETAQLHALKVEQNLHSSISETTKSEPMNAKYSIVVLTYRHSDDVVNLIRSLEKYTCDDSYEVILVNNGNEHLDSVAAASLSRYRLLNIDFNYGCSGGRNVAAKYAKGKYVVFIDDDGVLLDNSIEELISTAEMANAISVRGKVLPRNTDLPKLPHYDLGDLVMPAVSTTEGISIWEREVFLEFGGFDVLLSGHEGLLLTCKMFRFWGHRYFLYSPEAVLLHDYTIDKNSTQIKQKKHRHNREYVEFNQPNWQDIYNSFSYLQEGSNKSNERLISINDDSHFFSNREELSSDKVSIITTAKNASQFLSDYTFSIKSQTYQNFEVVFVDDDSSDDTVSKILELWDNDDRLVLVNAKGAGRAEALNTAIETATSEICLILDADDIIVPHRIEWTLGYFSSYPNSTCVSFFVFNEKAPYRAAKPFLPTPVDLIARSFVSMPAAFPSFAFKRSVFTELFDVNLEAGIDCDWIFNNVFNNNVVGHLIPLSSTYYRLHSNQITATKGKIQREVALKNVLKLHREVCGNLNNEQEKLISIFSGWSPLKSVQELDNLYEYLCLLSIKLKKRYPLSANDITMYLLSRWEQLKIEFFRKEFDSYSRELSNTKSLKQEAKESAMGGVIQEHYRKYLSSKMILFFSPILPNHFKKRMRKRMRKNERRMYIG